MSDSITSVAGTRIGQASECFVYWKDPMTNDTWGLNFTSPIDAKQFRECCVSTGLCLESFSTKVSVQQGSRYPSTEGSFANCHTATFCACSAVKKVRISKMKPKQGEIHINICYVMIRIPRQEKL